MKDIVFINKYEYMRSYTRCSQVNFLKNAEIEAGIVATLNNLKQVRINEKDLENDSNDEDFDNESIDSYEEYRINKFENEIINLDELDIEKNKEIDPKIIEGIIIDKRSKEYIKSCYSVDVVIDYDDEQYKQYRFDNIKAAAKTQEDIKELKKLNKTFILFQPTFINKTIEGSMYVTKCDAIVYLNSDECLLIEVKGTTSSKIIHLLDFLFQYFVLLNDENNLTITEYKLCLVKYCRAKKNEVPFILSDTLNMSKTSPNLTKNEKELLSDNRLIEMKQQLKLGKYHLLINDILEKNLSEDYVIDYLKESISENRKISQATKIVNDANKKIDVLMQEFENRINILSKRKISYKKIINLKPCSECKSEYKNCEYWLKCRELFKLEFKNGNKSLEPFIYSGNVINFKSQLNYYENWSQDSILPIKDKYEFFLSNKSNINISKSKDLLNLLKSRKKRVYFDFESLNTAIRPLDNVFPFNQIITQNSIVKTNNYYQEYYCNDMIKDPKYLDLNWIKSIIDNLYEDDEVWYIVYNKNFESTRLDEMAKLINEVEYNNKVKKIIDNIFDLADFFTPSKELIMLNDLHGFYSIKKVLELIPQSILDETKTKSYHDLEVYNGAVAQEVTTKRFFDLVSDEEWLDIERNLKIYCQNDVRAMIAVEKFIINILDNLNE